MNTRTDTRQALLDLAGRLFLRQGYLGFSYQDLADRLKLRKASIHYHFPAKEDLGTAVLQEYLGYFRSWREQLAKKPAENQFSAFVAFFKDFLAYEGICPCGMASAEYLMLPAAMQQVLQSFFDEQLITLTGILQAAQAKGLLGADLQPDVQALVLGSTLQGALQMARLRQSPELFEQVMEQAWQNVPRSSDSA
jgi:TetR/AcrR family transcriptional repressor of nem operon